MLLPSFVLCNPISSFGARCVHCYLNDSFRLVSHVSRRLRRSTGRRLLTYHARLVATQFDCECDAKEKDALLYLAGRKKHVFIRQHMFRDKESFASEKELPILTCAFMVIEADHKRRNKARTRHFSSLLRPSLKKLQYSTHERHKRGVDVDMYSIILHILDFLLP